MIGGVPWQVSDDGPSTVGEEPECEVVEPKGAPLKDEGEGAVLKDEEKGWLQEARVPTSVGAKRVGC